MFQAGAKESAVLIEQAIFTSAESDRAVGYHLVARSPGVDEGDARELTVWGPSHDSLESSSVANAASVNFFRLPSGAYCVSKTQLAGEEYSGRGLRTYTHCLVVPPPVLLRFANNPFALLRAAWAKGMLRVCDGVPNQMVPFQLAGRAAAVDEGLIGQLVEQFEPSTIAKIIEAILQPLPVVVIGVRKPEATVAGLLNLLPQSARREITFATGLKYASRRQFHLLTASEESAELRRLYRQHLVTLIDVAPDYPRLAVTEADSSRPAESPRADRSSRSGGKAPGAGRAPATSSRPTTESTAGGWGGFVAECLKRDLMPLIVEQLNERKEGLHIANLNELGDHLCREIQAHGEIPRSKSEGNTTFSKDTSRAPVAPPGLQPEESTSDDAFLAMLLGGHPQPDAGVTRGHCSRDQTVHAKPDAAAARKSQPSSRTVLKAPSVSLDIDSPELLDRLEKLDDVVFEAISGDARALDEIGRLWPQLLAELGPDKLEESREQYLRYALSIWEVCLEDGLREPERAISSLQVLSVIFGER
jgi:hypothetical protein